MLCDVKLYKQKEGRDNRFTRGLFELGYIKKSFLMRRSIILSKKRNTNSKKKTV